MSASLPLFTGKSGQEVSSELNKVILAWCSLPGMQGCQRWGFMYKLIGNIPLVVNS